MKTAAQKWSEEHRPHTPQVDALAAKYHSKMTTRLRIFTLARELEMERDELLDAVNFVLHGLKSGFIKSAAVLSTDVGENAMSLPIESLEERLEALLSKVAAKRQLESRSNER